MSNFLKLYFMLRFSAESGVQANSFRYSEYGFSVFFKEHYTIRRALFKMFPFSHVFYPFSLLNICCKNCVDIYIKFHILIVSDIEFEY